MKISYCGKGDVVGGQMYSIYRVICPKWPESLKGERYTYFGTKKEVLRFMRESGTPKWIIKEFKEKSGISREKRVCIGTII